MFSLFLIIVREATVDFASSAFFARNDLSMLPFFFGFLTFLGSHPFFFLPSGFVFVRFSFVFFHKVAFCILFFVFISSLTTFFSTFLISVFFGVYLSVPGMLCDGILGHLFSHHIFFLACSFCLVIS